MAPRDTQAAVDDGGLAGPPVDDRALPPPNPPVDVDTAAPVVERALPSGRTLVLRVGSAGEDLEIRSAAGELDLRISLTDKGPVVSLRGARLELESVEDVAFRCRDFDVQASGTARIVADELRAKTTRDIHLNGEFVRLNCTPEGEVEAQARLAQMEALMSAQAAATTPQAASDPCCTGGSSEP